MLEKQSISLKNNTIERTSEFMRAFDILEDSHDNLFIMGKAGTGKSTFLEYFRKHTSKNVAVLAPTGVSALNVKGQTIHSFFRFKPRLITADSIRPKRDRKLYEKLDLLIIDEISMVRADIFDGIEQFLRLNGPKPGKPFGGVQICVIGDLFQLPPIVSRTEQEVFSQLYPTPFFFSAHAFDLAHFGVVELTKIYRQSDDLFIRALNHIRNGNAIDPVINFINKRHNVPLPPSSGKPVILCSTNYLADRINAQKLNELPTAEFCYEGKRDGTLSLQEEKLPSPQQLRLKVGTQVMFTKNHSGKRWVNGTIGMVESLSENEIVVTICKNNKAYTYAVPRETWETIQYHYDEDTGKIEENVIGEYCQYPLMPAWAITIHKSQGKTLDSVIIDLGQGAFAPGQLYVALSRCRDYHHMALHRPISKRDILCDPDVVSFHRHFIG